MIDRKESGQFGDKKRSWRVPFVESRFSSREELSTKDEVNKRNTTMRGQTYSLALIRQRTGKTC